MYNMSISRAPGKNILHPHLPLLPHDGQNLPAQSGIKFFKALFPAGVYSDITLRWAQNPAIVLTFCICVLGSLAFSLRLKLNS
jgi:hypothetical protein